MIVSITPDESGTGGTFCGRRFSGLFLLLGFYALFLFIRFLDRAIKALDIYLDEKRGRRL